MHDERAVCSSETLAFSLNTTRRNNPKPYGELKREYENGL
jgi:hypothetical protein